MRSCAANGSARLPPTGSHHDQPALNTSIQVSSSPHEKAAWLPSSRHRSLRNVVREPPGSLWLRYFLGAPRCKVQPIHLYFGFVEELYGAAERHADRTAASRSHDIADSPHQSGTLLLEPPPAYWRAKSVTRSRKAGCSRSSGLLRICGTYEATALPILAVAAGNIPSIASLAASKASSTSCG